MSRPARTGALRAMATGLRRTAAEPGMVLGLWAFNLLAALPAAWALTGALRSSIGASRVQEKLRVGFDMEWFGRFGFDARGLETTFRPTVAGAGGFLDNLEGWLTGDMFVRFAPLLVLGLVYALARVLLMGGVVDRYVRPGQGRGLARFLGASGRFFFRFARLAVISAGAYALIYLGSRRVYRWLGHLTRDVTDERTVFLWSAAVLASTALLLVIVHLAFTYAKVATALEERRSMLLAAFRGLRFVARRPIAVLGLYLGLAFVSGLLIAAWHVLAPVAGPSTWTGVVLAFLAGQAWLIARLGVRLSMLGGAVALYEDSAGAAVPPTAGTQTPRGRFSV